LESGLVAQTVAIGKAAGGFHQKDRISLISGQKTGSRVRAGKFAAWAPVWPQACPRPAEGLKDSVMASPQDPPRPGPTGPIRTEKEVTKDRLAAALRENLRRRKAQKAGRASGKTSAPPESV
jgi:hypothetical protein